MRRGPATPTAATAAAAASAASGTSAAATHLRAVTASASASSPPHHQQSRGDDSAVLDSAPPRPTPPPSTSTPPPALPRTVSTTSLPSAATAQLSHAAIPQLSHLQHPASAQHGVVADPTLASGVQDADAPVSPNTQPANRDARAGMQPELHVGAAPARAGGAAGAGETAVAAGEKEVLVTGGLQLPSTGTGGDLPLDAGMDADAGGEADVAEGADTAGAMGSVDMAGVTDSADTAGATDNVDMEGATDSVDMAGATHSASAHARAGAEAAGEGELAQAKEAAASEEGANKSDGTGGKSERREEGVDSGTHGISPHHDLESFSPSHGHSHHGHSHHPGLDSEIPAVPDTKTTTNTSERSTDPLQSSLMPARAVQSVDDYGPTCSDAQMVLQEGHLQSSVDVKLELPVHLPQPLAALAPPVEFANAMTAVDTVMPYTTEDLAMPFPDPIPQAPALAQPATGFAKLEFEDGHFYMTTYAVELGRDMRAFRVAQQYQARREVQLRDHQVHRPRRSASVPGTPVRPIRNDTAASARSFLSDVGGIVGEDDGHIQLKKRKKKKKSSKSRSTDTSDSSHSHSMSRKNSVGQPQAKFDYFSAAMEQTVDPNNTAPLDPMVHMPDPSFTPLIPVHPPLEPGAEDDFNTGKGISRKHVKIQYNFDLGHFEMDVKGRNGAFHDGNYVARGSSVPLHDGSVIQIGGVEFRFVLPTVALDGERADHAEADFDSVSGRMSFNFEDGRGESIMADDEELEGYSSPSHRGRSYTNDFDDLALDEALLNDDDDMDEDEEDLVETPRKRAVGRPPVIKKKSAKDRRAEQLKVAADRKRPKIKIKLSKRDKAKAREEARRQAKAKAEAEAAAAEQEREKKEKLAKQKAKEAAKVKEAAKAKEVAKTKDAAKTKEAAKLKEAAKTTATAKAAIDAEVKDEIGTEPELQEMSKESTKEASKTPGTDSPAAAKPVVNRIARDAPMANGDQITVPGLPAGIIIPARKKGPGRPPKDGVMSKRERALLIKAARERDKAIKMGIDPATIPMPENRPPKPKPRRNSKGELIDGEENDESRPRAPRPAGTPEPEMKIEDYTEEQLIRPSANYVYLIYEAIQNAKGGIMNLQQIYSAIERRYPWYKFRAGSNGWQSSVRHNLSQHEAFYKAEKDGKGWLWGIKEGVPIERERKKKSPPPSAPPYQPGNGYPQQPYGSQAPGQLPPYPPGQYPQGPSGAPSNGQMQGRPPAAGAPPMNGQNHPNGYTPHPPHTNRPAPKSHRSRNDSYRGHAAPDVVETFTKVFISTYASKNNGDTPKAERIVKNAVKRVLEPHTLRDVPMDPQEESVINAFRTVLSQSQGSPRMGGSGGGFQHRPSPQRQPGALAPHPHSGQPSAAPPHAYATAATGNLTPAAGAHPNPPPPQPLSNSSAGGQLPRTNTPGGSSQPSRTPGPYETQLLGSVMGILPRSHSATPSAGGARSESPAMPPAAGGAPRPSAQPAPSAPTPTIPASQIVATPSPAPAVGPHGLSAMGLKLAQSLGLKINGYPSTKSEFSTTAATTQIPAATTPTPLVGQPEASVPTPTTTQSSAEPAMFAPAAAPVPTSAFDAASSSTSTQAKAPATAQPPIAAVPPLILDLGDAAMAPKRTMTPTRPVVEPLTPPALHALPRTSASGISLVSKPDNPAATATSAISGVKRVRSISPAAPVEEGKRSRTEGPVVEAD